MNLLTNHAKHLKIVSAVLALTILSLIIFIIVINSRPPENETSFQFLSSENQTEKTTEVEILSNGIQHPIQIKYTNFIKMTWSSISFFTQINPP